MSHNLDKSDHLDTELGYDLEKVKNGGCAFADIGVILDIGVGVVRDINS